MREASTHYGVCTRGSTGPPRDATRRAACGGAATTSTASAESPHEIRWHERVSGPPRSLCSLPPEGEQAFLGTARRKANGDLATNDFRASLPASVLRRLGLALRGPRDGHHHLVCIHVDDERDAHAGRLDDVDGVDADARTIVDRRRGVIPWHVGRDDGRDDAAILGARAVELSRDCRRD